MQYKIVERAQLKIVREKFGCKGKRVVFTNGCFDLLHRGHVEMLMYARSLGDALLVGLNSDDSVRALKGPNRPFIDEEDRAVMLTALECVSYVSVFEEMSVESLVAELLPDILVKGGDYCESEIVGASQVKSNGGSVYSLPFWQDKSTTQLIERLQANSVFGQNTR